jgi:hypothetical protein
MRKASAALAVAAFALSSCALGPPAPGGFVFGVMGDTPYLEGEVPRVTAMIERMNAEPLAFVIHVGDIKAGSNSPCTDALFEERRAQLDRSTHPLVYTPGDNEWVDCRRKTNGGFDPLERLQRLREIFFARPHLGSGELEVASDKQVLSGCGGYPENRTWTYDRVRFATVNIQGSHNNERFDERSDAEALCRNAANGAWIEEAARLAQSENARALVIATQADPWVERARGFSELLAQIPAVARRLQRPVLFVHGDTHLYKYDTPFTDANGPMPNASRLVTYGSPLVGWVRVTVDPASAAVFRVEPELQAIVR